MDTLYFLRQLVLPSKTTSDGIWLKRSWCGEVRNLSILVCFGVGEDGFREVLGVAEGAKEDKERWLSFLRHMKT